MRPVIDLPALPQREQCRRADNGRLHNDAGCASS
jgi:hypothetical protein